MNKFTQIYMVNERRFINRYALLLLFFMFGFVEAQDAKEIVKKAHELIRANSSYSLIRMTIIKPDWSREMEMKTWALEPDYAIVLVTSPAKEKGTVTLKRETEIWQWLPSINRVIKIPPSMMMQSWMGSDFTNDDLVRESSVVGDYTHKILGEDSLSGYLCYKIELTPKPQATVVWGKIVMRITKESYLQLQTDYYDEDGTKMREMNGSEVKEIGGRTIPVHWEMIPLDEEGHRTVMDYLEINFNIDINQSFFSQQNMKRIR